MVLVFLSLLALTYGVPVVLVHGAFDTSSAWTNVISSLNSDTIVTPILKGHPGDATPPASVTFPDYVSQITAVVQAQSGPVVLVGHSLGGMIISQVAENIPASIHSLIYVAAFLPQNGDSPGSLSAQDSGSNFGKQIQYGPGYATLSGPLSQVFDNACPLPQSDLDALTLRIVTDKQQEPLVPFLYNVTLTANFNGVPKHYIVTTNDLAISTAFQRSMSSKYTLVSTQDIDSCHLVPECQSSNLADMLNAIINPASLVTPSLLVVALLGLLCDFI